MTAPIGTSPENLLGEFLRARRELARPEEHGLPDLGRRRVPGLRREEVAMLAGISAEYYVRLERGRDRHPSAQVVDALARVLRLDEESRQYLTNLAVPGGPPRRRPARVEKVRPVVVRLLESMPTVPAFVLGHVHDVLAYNRMAELLCGSMPRNMLRHVFLDEAASRMYLNWPEIAADAVAALRASAGTDLDDPALTALVGELTLKSPEFARLWARHDVRAKTSGTKRLVTPSVGEIEISWESLSVTSAPGQLIVTYFAAPGSASEQALKLLTSLDVERPAVVVAH